MEFRVKVNRFPGAPAAMRKAIGIAFASAGKTILQDEQNRTPVDTGELRASETMTSSEEELRFLASAPHSLYVHEGTRKMGARPFMRQAVEAGVPAIESAIAAAAARELA